MYNNPEFHTCCTCGYSWRHGQDGSHSCSVQMANEIAKLREELAAARESSLDRLCRLQAAMAINNDLKRRAESAEAKLKSASEQEPVYFAYDGSDVGDGWSTACKAEYDSTPEEWRKVLYAHPPVPADVPDRVIANPELLDQIQAQQETIAELEALSVAKILKCVDEEKDRYFGSVDEVVAKLSELYAEVENYELGIKVAPFYKERIAELERKLAEQQAKLERRGYNFGIDGTPELDAMCALAAAKAREEGRRERG